MIAVRQRLRCSPNDRALYLPATPGEGGIGDTFDLQRFVTAQDRVIEDVRAELRAGRKRSHWMWFVFPQIAGLGRSLLAQKFALRSLDEARAYLRHGVLGPRLVECARLVMQVEGRAVHDIFGSPDDLKFHSCMTLFGTLPFAARVFAEALDKYFAGKPDQPTLDRL